MKKLLFMLVFTLFGLECWAGEPILPYGQHSKKEIEDFILGTSQKSIQFRDIFISKMRKEFPSFTEKSIIWALGYVQEEEISLKDGEYENHYWNPSLKKIIPCHGRDWQGNVMVFRYEGHSIVLCKADCLNPLNIFEKKYSSPPVPAPMPTPAPVYNGGKKDTTVVMVVVQVQNQGTNQSGNWQRTGVTFIPDRNEDYSQPDYWYNRGGSYNGQGYGVVSCSQSACYQPQYYRPQQSCYHPRAERPPRSNPPTRVINPGFDPNTRVTNPGFNVSGGTRVTSGGF